MEAKGWQRHRVDDEASASTLAAPPVSSPVANPQAVSWVTLLGQAATLITLATALIFLAGNFVLYTRSYFERFPWYTLLQEFPVKDIQLIGATAALPALIIALVWTYLAERLQSRLAEDSTRFNWSIRLLPLVGVIVLAMFTPASVGLYRTAYGSELYRSQWTCFAVPLIAGAVLYLVALAFIKPILALKSIGLRRAFFVVATTLVVMPSVASFLGTFPFPAVQVCTKDYGSMTGRLVGVSDKSTYVATSGLPLGTHEAVHFYVLAIPLEQVEQTYVGITGITCPKSTATPTAATAPV
jgi:hypothetical protein